MPLFLVLAGFGATLLICAASHPAEGEFATPSPYLS
jgi:hypothetical protein